VIVGVNKYKFAKEDPLDSVEARDIDNRAKCEKVKSQRLQQIRATRDTDAKSQAALGFAHSLSRRIGHWQLA
jgi:methylmalonyl-CoA mutase